VVQKKSVACGELAMIKKKKGLLMVAAPDTE